MERVAVTISVPKEMCPYIDNKNNELTFEQSAMLLYPLIQNCVISHGRAAEILGVPKWDLIDYYADIGLPYLNQSVEELEKEIASYRHVVEKQVT